MNQSIKRKIANFLRDESGPTAVEYAIMMALIIAVCITAITSLGNATSASITNSVNLALPSNGN